MANRSRRQEKVDRATTELVRLIGQTRRRLWIAAARALAAHGESIVAWVLVSRLAELGALTQRELADASAQHPAGVSRQLAELVRRGLVARGPDLADRRRRVVRLTPAGQRFIGRTRPRVDRATGSVLASLGPGERRVLTALLRKVAADEPLGAPRARGPGPSPRALRRRPPGSA